jgi:hypothetical protein
MMLNGSLSSSPIAFFSSLSLSLSLSLLSQIPMPNFVGSDCDDMKGKPCRGCPCGSGYPGGNTNTSFPNPFGKDLEGKNTAITDLITVPRVPPGDYVVGFRWDCETSSQVWSTCADITIA